MDYNYYTGQCSCASLVDPGIFDSGIIAPAPHATLIANQKVSVKWASNGTATSFSLDLERYVGQCNITTSQDFGSCRFSEVIERVLDGIPNTGEAIWTPSMDLESRGDYVLSAKLMDKDNLLSETYLQGFYTILKEEGDVPVFNPTPEEINRNLTEHATTSSSTTSVATMSMSATTTATTEAKTSVPTGAAITQTMGSKKGLISLLYSLLAVML